MNEHVPCPDSTAATGDPTPGTGHRAATSPPVLDSQTLLRGHKEAIIAHNGVTYRLQATRQGKLILIK